MKKLIVVTILVSFSFISHAFAKGGEFKIGYFDLDSLLNIMPQMQAVTDSSNHYAADLQKELDRMQQSYTDMVIAYDSVAGRLSKDAREAKEKMIRMQDENIQGFKKAAQKDIENYRGKLVMRIYDLIKVASEKVATRLGYAYILDGSKTNGCVLFGAQSYNVFNEMCIELKIPLPKK